MSKRQLLCGLAISLVLTGPEGTREVLEPMIEKIRAR